eukprot:3958059-Alexandrium_andersonii.AAC.1
MVMLPGPGYALRVGAERIDPDHWATRRGASALLCGVGFRVRLAACLFSCTHRLPHAAAR